MITLAIVPADVDSYLNIGGVIAFAVALGILAYHELKVFQAKDLKERYDYVTTHEIRFFWYSVVALIISAAFFLHTIIGSMLPVEPDLHLYVGLFFLLAFAVVAYFIANSAVRILYPKVIENRLKRIRDTPRISPAGNVMRKLAEEEESVHLDQAAIDEQASAIHAAEYDVWLDEKTGYKKIEKYMGYQHAEKCGECGFFTMKIHSEEIREQPTKDKDGLLIKHFRCSYCNHREARAVVIAKLSSNQ
jgi:hypothetical protein